MRWYTIETADSKKVRLPSVTTILDVTMTAQRRSNLVRAQVKKPVAYHQKMTTARKRGNAIDHYIKAKLADKTLALPADYAKYRHRIDPWVRSLKESGSLFWTDQIVHDTDHGYAGTLDIVCSMPGLGIAVVDIKTTAYKVHPEAMESAMLQTAAYRAAWNLGKCTLRADAIAAVFISPYGLSVHAKSGNDVENYTEQFYRRCKQFASAYSQSFA